MRFLRRRARPRLTVILAHAGIHLACGKGISDLAEVRQYCLIPLSKQPLILSLTQAYKHSHPCSDSHEIALHSSPVQVSCSLSKRISRLSPTTSSGSPPLNMLPERR